MDLKRLKHLVALADTHQLQPRRRQPSDPKSANFSRSIQAAEESDLQLFDRGR